MDIQVSQFKIFDKEHNQIFNSNKNLDAFQSKSVHK
jgi:hypothetical protein